MTHSVFGGTLVRHGKDDWRFIDGTLAVGVRDESINSHNFRCSGGYVHVPLVAARHPGNPELRFAADGLDAGRYRMPFYAHGCILVPLGDWDEHAKEPIGAVWDQEIEHYVLDKAQDLGWSWNGQRDSLTAGA